MTSGYSGSATARKLGIAEGGRLLLVRPDPCWCCFDLPAGATAASWVPPATLPEPLAPDTVVLAFFTTAAAYLDDIGALARGVFPSTPLWVAWPRRAGGHDSDLTDGVVRDAALPLGLVDNKVAAVDDDWSALRFTWRTELRAGPAPSRPAG